MKAYLSAVVLSLSLNQAMACQTYSLAEIADAVRNSPYASDAIKNNACTWGGAAMAESAGKSCSDNGNNYGVLQLTQDNLPSGVSPEAYKNMTLQQQVDIWAQYGGPDKQGSGFNYLRDHMGETVNGVTINQGMLAACSQFGGLICASNVDFIRQNGACQTLGNGGVRATRATLNNRTANLDGNGQSICSWGDVIQAKINASGCGQGSMNCGPGDFPTQPAAVASGAPPLSASDITVNDGQV